MTQEKTIVTVIAMLLLFLISAIGIYNAPRSLEKAEKIDTDPTITSFEIKQQPLLLRESHITISISGCEALDIDMSTATVEEIRDILILINTIDSFQHTLWREDDLHWLFQKFFPNCCHHKTGRLLRYE